jgi:hypothetical protein
MLFRQLLLLLAREAFYFVTALAPTVYIHCEFTLMVFGNSLLATLFSLAALFHSLHIYNTAWHNTSYGVIHTLCLINVYHTYDNVSPQVIQTPITFPVVLERPKRPLATDSWFPGASPRLVSKRFPRAGAKSWAQLKGIFLYS